MSSAQYKRNWLRINKKPPYELKPDSALNITNQDTQHQTIYDKFM